MNQLTDLVERVAEYGGGPEVTYRIPDNASIRLDDRHDGSHLLAGATITAWVEDGQLGIGDADAKAQPHRQAQ